MKFNEHSALRTGQIHAFLSPSKYHWINYSEEKLARTYKNYHAAQFGTRVHNVAAELIELGIKLPNQEKALNMFVNDAIGFRMAAEQPIVYSVNAFGTADAISFRDNMLRIHDLKTGVTKVSMHQPEVYTAYFCLEYDLEPSEIAVELRIYQGADIIVHIPDPKDIMEIMLKTVKFDKIIEKLKQELE